MYKKLSIKTITSFLIILLLPVFFIVLSTPKVSAEVSISQLSPSKGIVGTVVSLTGQISTENGSYRIFFGDKEVQSGTATLYDVSDTFIVPNSTSGDHLVKLQDVTSGENSTIRKFIVLLHYSVNVLTPPYPDQLQEGTSIDILATVTGGNATTFANITVTDPANVTHLSNITISIDSDGFGEVKTTYPTDFDENPHTFYVGTYNISFDIFNETLATSNFTIGLTDAIEYYRFQTVYIQAANYTTTDFLEITISHNGETVKLTPSNASGPQGIITANWTIPANASIGLYKVDVTYTKQMGFEKPVPDSQNFTIASKSFACEVKTFNLDNAPIEGVLIEANNTATQEISTNFTNEWGIASFYLEAANYTFKAFWNTSQAPRAQVGGTSEISLAENLTGDSAITITCSLADIKIAVKDVKGNMLPFVDIRVNFTYTSRLGVPINQSLSYEVNITGITIFRNMFTNVNYTIKASRYGYTFDTSTINLIATSWLNVTCPTYTLIINVYNRNGLALQDAQVKVYEWSTGTNATDDFAQQSITNENGNVEFNFTFGKYGVLVYVDGAILNTTVVDLVNESTVFEVYCKLYPLTLDVKVLDYFGQGIANSNVTIEREGTVLSSSNTGVNGIAQFTELVGGNYKIFVYLGKRPYKITTLYLQEPKTITLKIAEIMSIGGFIAETSHFITIVLILSLIVVFLFAFVYRRLKVTRKKEQQIGKVYNA